GADWRPGSVAAAPCRPAAPLGGARKRFERAAGPHGGEGSSAGLPRAAVASTAPRARPCARFPLALPSTGCALSFLHDGLLRAVGGGGGTARARGALARAG